MLDFYTVAFITSALVSGSLAVAAWGRRSAPGAMGLVLLSAGQCLWSTVYALQWILTDHGPSLPWLVLRLVGLQVIPAALLIMALDFTGRRRQLTQGALAALAVEPIAVLLLAATDPLHGLYLGGSEPSMYFVAGGPLFIANVAYSYGLFVAAAAFLIMRIVRQRAQRHQTAILLLGTMIPVIHYFIQLLGLFPNLKVNAAPFSFALTGIALWIALARLGLFRVVPLARDVLMERMSEGVMLLDAQRTIVDINPSAYELLGIRGVGVGFTSEEALPHLLEMILDLRVQLSREGSGKTVFETPHGRIVEASAIHIESARGEDVSTLAVFRDVTERERSKRELVELSERLAETTKRSRRILGALAEGVVLLDAEGVVVDANPSSADILGVDHARMTGRNVEEVAPQLAELHRTAGGSTDTRRAGIRLKSGRVVDAESIAVDSADLPEGHRLLIIRDETDRVVTERRQRDFVAAVSHELQTPLTALALTAKTIARVAETDPAAAGTFALRLSDDVHRLSRLTSELMTLARVSDAGAARAATSEVDLSELVQEVAGRHRPIAESRDIALTVHCPRPVMLAGDEMALEIVVSNLLENALRYTDAGGSVTVAVDLGGDADEDGHARLMVSDTGIGIPPEDQERVFERFYRVDKARSRATGGTGLGLSVVHAAVERHRGRIRLNSAPGEGTEFVVLFPLD